MPSKARQVEEISKLLDLALESEDFTTEELAKKIVEAYRTLLKFDIQRAPLVPHPGMAFSHAALSGVHYVAFQREGRNWIISATSQFGYFVTDASSFWKYAEVSNDNRKPRRVKDPENGGETGEVIPVGPRPGSPGQNPLYDIGDQVSRSQRARTFEVVATGDKCVLLRNVTNGTLTVESNHNMQQYYRKEKEVNPW